MGKGGKNSGTKPWQGPPKSKWEKRAAKIDERLDRLESKGLGVFSAIAGPTIGIYQWVVPVTLWLRVVLLLAAGALMWVALLNLKALAFRTRLVLLIVWPFVAIAITWWSVFNSPYQPRYSDRQVVVVDGTQISTGELNLNNAAILVVTGSSSPGRITFSRKEGVSLQTTNIPAPVNRGFSGFAVTAFGDEEWVFSRSEGTSHVIKISNPDGRVERFMDRIGMWPNRSFKLTWEGVNDKSTAAATHIEYSFLVEER